jgi:hypothetical protein
MPLRSGSGAFWRWTVKLNFKCEVNFTVSEFFLTFLFTCTSKSKNAKSQLNVSIKQGGEGKLVRHWK